MTTEREMERIVRSWLEPGVTTLTDDVLDAVMDQLPSTPQRRPIWLLRRTMSMHPLAKFSIAAAAVLVVALVGFNLLSGPGQSGAGGSPPSPSPSPSPTATPTPSPTASLAPPSPSPSRSIGQIAPGPFRFSYPGFTTPFTVTIPSTGWYGDPAGIESWLLVKNDSADPPDGAGMIVFSGDLWVYGDPCHWLSTTPKDPATTVDDIVAALGEQATRAASKPVDIVVDGHPGRSITLRVPDDVVFDDCDDNQFGTFAAVLYGKQDRTPSRYHQGPGQIDEFWIVDVDGVPAVIDVAWYEGTPQADIDDLHAMIESATFD
jgi:hypothetical protein